MRSVLVVTMTVLFSASVVGACGGSVLEIGGDAGATSDSGNDAATTKKPTQIVDGKCPAGLAGPALVAALTPSGATYCIDATEVTNDDYAAFLATKPDPTTQAAACSKNASFTPPFNWPKSAADAKRPIVNVDWCDAKAFCEWAGKELCGAPGQAAAPAHDFQNAATSLWYSACSAVGNLVFPYGNDYEPATCNGADYDTAYTLDVDQPASCALVKNSDSTPLVDMSGNVWEWENACEGDGPTDRCRVRGGSFRSNLESLTCAASTMVDRGSQFDDFGIRCCVE